MKKLTYLIAAFGFAVGVTSCDLAITPETDVAGPDAGSLQYVEGLRNGIYNSTTVISSYSNMRYPDYYTDLFNETNQSGNRGGYFSRWALLPSDQDCETIWSSYYSLISTINYTIGKADVALGGEQLQVNIDKLNMIKGEMYFFRAYMLHQLALRFCQDYDPATASTQFGVPAPTTYNPAAQLSRGTLDKTYAQILEDITAAEAVITVAGSQNAIRVNVDAITAFKAQVALQMHDYDNAIIYAKSLYAAYPLVSTKADMLKMWEEDSSPETILQLDLSKITAGMVENTTYDYTSGTWNAAAGYYDYDPAYVPEQWVCNSFDKEKDIRFGTCIDESHTKIITDETKGLGILVIKFNGNKNLFSLPTTLAYINMPKLFRVAEMYLIEAEAQYRKGGDALTALNALRVKRGLAGVSSTGDALFADIQNESVREFIGEGRRLFDLKRWAKGIKRDAQTLFMSTLSGGTSVYQMSVPATNPRWVWPIPQNEIYANPNFGKQNNGYM